MVSEKLVANETVFYDEAGNLELRGVLQRELHGHVAHLLPAEEAPDRPRRTHKREPIRESEHHTIIDLVRVLFYPAQMR